jgi:hypothetical protein
MYVRSSDRFLIAFLLSYYIDRISRELDMYSVFEVFRGSYRALYWLVQNISRSTPKARIVPRRKSGPRNNPPKDPIVVRGSSLVGPTKRAKPKQTVKQT